MWSQLKQMTHSKENKFYITEDLYYTIFRIKNRVICAPCEELKQRQRYFLKAFKRIYKLKMDTYKSAKIHAGKKWILKMDIKDFFNSISIPEIQHVIKKTCDYIQEGDNSLYYLSLVTINSKLPTGAPTSPYIANACFEHIEKYIKSFCNIYCVEFSRYMDDLTFSSNDKTLLKIIENQVYSTLNSFGYSVNKRKTKYISNNKQQNILGLVVNYEQVRITKDLKRNIRAMLHSYAISKNGNEMKSLKHLTWNNEQEYRLKGYIAYIKHVDAKFYNKLKSYAKKLEYKYYTKITFFDDKTSTFSL